MKKIIMLLAALAVLATTLSFTVASKKEATAQPLRETADVKPVINEAQF